MNRSIYIESSALAPRFSGLRLVQTQAWALLVTVAIGLWTVLLFIDVRADYLAFRLGRFDLGNMTQAVWSTVHGRPLEVTLASGEQSSRLASHVDPILAILAPAWLIWPSPLVLAFVQVAACALGAIPVYLLARRHLASEPVAALLALGYLAYPWLVSSALDAMHPATLAIPLFLYAIWFLDSDRLGWFALFAGLAASTGELMGLPLFVLGLWYWHSQQRRRAGVVIATAGLAWSLAAVELIVPAFSGRESAYYRYFDAVGGSPEGVIATLITDPLVVASALFTRPDLIYWFLLSAPLVGLFVLSPGITAVAFPQLLVNGLADGADKIDPREHYVAAVVPFLIAGTVFAFTRLPERTRERDGIVVLAVCLAVTGAVRPSGALENPTIWVDGDLTLARKLSQRERPANYAAVLADAVSLIPHDDAVSATNRAGSHLSARSRFLSVPAVEEAEWIVLDTWDPWVPPRGQRRGGWHPVLLERFKQKIAADDAWRRVFHRSGVMVYRRTE